MATLAIRGNNERAEDIARLFKDLGAKGESSPCSDESYLYYIGFAKKVLSIIDQPDNIYRKLLFNVYTIEEFEAKFPYRVGDKVAYDEFYSTKEPAVEKVAHVRYRSWDYNHNDVCYTMEDGTIRRVDEIRKVETEFEPKDGDVVTVTTETGGSYTCFFKFYVGGDVHSYGGLNNLFNMLFKDALVCYREKLITIYPATEEEKKKLFDKLAEEGWEWRTDTKELVKLKWKPKEGEYFYSPYL